MASPAEASSQAAAAPARGSLLPGCGLMAASGFASLACQIVWTQQASAWLGHEAAAMLAVVTAFFGGLALGAWLLGRHIDATPRPRRWYVVCEAVIGIWALVLAVLQPAVGAALLALTGPLPSPGWQWAVAFGGTFVLLLPATAAMGATLPAMERLVARRTESGSPVAALYAINTAGAVVGLLVAAFWLVPEFGLVRSAALAAATSLACAAGARFAFGPDAAVAPRAAVPSGQAPPLRLLALTGLLGIGYEVIVVRVLCQVSENTVYTFAMLLALYLLGTAAGAAVAAHRDATSATYGSLDRLLALLAVTVLLGAASLYAAPSLKATTAGLLGGGLAAALTAEAAVAAVVFLPATAGMGALFTTLCTLARRSGIGLGKALAINTAGAAAAPVILGALAVPLIGTRLALLLLAFGYLALRSRRSWRSATGWVLAAAAATATLAAPELLIIDLPPGGRVVEHREGAMAHVAVVEDASGVRTLRIDNRQQEGSSATRLADARQAVLPLLLHPGPRNALFLGLGTGTTAMAALDEPGLELDVVELVPEVVAAARHFEHGYDAATAPPRVRVHVADARRFARAANADYDLVVSDNFHPARSGSAMLYTVEHFLAVRGRLASGGVFCQWLPVHQLDLPTLRSIVRSYLEAFPGAYALLATNSLDTPVLGLVASASGGGSFTLPAMRERLATAPPLLRPPAYGVLDEWALAGSFVAGPRALARFAAGAAANTDDRPIVAFRAPALAYAADSRPRDRLLALLAELDIASEESPSSAGTPADRERLAAYWLARDRYLRIGASARPISDPAAMLAQVGPGLLSVLRTSPDFRPAFDPMIRMADSLWHTDPAAAQQLLETLRSLRPGTTQPPAAEPFAP